MIPLRAAALVTILVLVVLATVYSIYRDPQPETVCTEVMANQTAVLPCKWIEGTDTYLATFGKRIRLRAFKEDGKLDDDTHGDDLKIWYETRQDLKIWAGLFESFRLHREEFERLPETPALIRVVERYGEPLPDPFVLTVNRSGEEWVVQTFADSNLRALPDHKSYGANSITWWIRFDPSDTITPSFILSCDDIAPNCVMEMQEQGLSMTVFFSRKWLGERERILAAMRSVTASMLAGTLEPGDDSIPCLVASAC